ncbi:MAG: hypothetical protein QM767_21195 [Anaeromyxobacter sp.]
MGWTQIALWGLAAWILLSLAGTVLVALFIQSGKALQRQLDRQLARMDALDPSNPVPVVLDPLPERFEPAASPTLEPLRLGSRAG